MRTTLLCCHLDQNSELLHVNYPLNFPLVPFCPRSSGGGLPVRSPVTTDGVGAAVGRRGPCLYLYAVTLTVGPVIKYVSLAPLAFRCLSSSSRARLVDGGPWLAITVSSFPCYVPDARIIHLTVHAWRLCRSSPVCSFVFSLSLFPPAGP